MIVLQILRAGTDDVNAWNVNKLTALHVAVERDQIDIVRELLKAGARQSAMPAPPSAQRYSRSSCQLSPVVRAAVQSSTCRR